jgi:Kef-type K+ transport system membrane component KefB
MNQLLITGSLIIIALYAGKLFNKLKFPIVTGYILIGFIIGNVNLPAINISGHIESISFYINTIALSILLFELGVEFNFDMLRNMQKKVIIMAVSQSLITFAVIFFSFTLFLNIPLPISLLIAAIGIATAPDITILTIREIGITNSFTTLLKNIVTIDDLIAELFFFILFPLAQNYLMHIDSLRYIISFSIREILLSITLGIFLGFLFSFFTKEFKRKIPVFAGTIGFLLTAIGISILLKTHTIIVLLITGVLFASTTKNKSSVLSVTKQIDGIMFILFLIVNGFALSFNLIKSAFLSSGLIFIISRSLGKISGGILGNFITGMDKKQAIPLGISILPQSSISIYFAAHSKISILNYGEKIFAITMSGVIFFEIIGAPLLKLAIQKFNQLNQEFTRQ